MKIMSIAVRDSKELKKELKEKKDAGMYCQAYIY